MFLACRNVECSYISLVKLQEYLILIGYGFDFLRRFYKAERYYHEHKKSLSIRLYNSDRELIYLIYEPLKELGFKAEIKDRGFPLRAKKRDYEIRIKGWKDTSGSSYQ
ncbi:MAG: hypothetical protein DRJ64_10725 [Thermoprotei archaeon]|nr:MAG: hypothetical protein DRJ64_10725 [Thermoprotei archaeon]